MNKKTLTISALLACFFLAVGFKENEAALALQKTTKQFHTDLNLTTTAIANMKAAIVRLDGSTASELAVQEAVTNARMAYKKSEFLIAYLDGFAVKKNINGAPLPSVCLLYTSPSPRD